MRTMLIVVLVLLALVIGYLAASARSHRIEREETDARIEKLAESVEHLAQMMERLITEQAPMEPGELYASWYSAGTPKPILREVKTARNAGESVTDWEARHDAAVATLRSTYPPV